MKKRKVSSKKSKKDTVVGQWMAVAGDMAGPYEERYMAEEEGAYMVEDGLSPVYLVRVVAYSGLNKPIEVKWEEV